MFDAYTIKKVMPRLVIAAILIQLSWPLFTLMLEATNQIAWGVEGLLYAPFGGRDELEIGKSLEAVAGTKEFLAVLAGGAAWVAIGAPGVLALAIGIILALLVAFFVLAIRQTLLVVMLVTAPIALVAWILPNTESIWKLWWGTFTKALLMYPIILLIIAGGRIAAWVVGESDIDGVLGTVMVLFVFFAPFFLIGKTFQFAGGAIGMAGGALSGRTSGLTKGLNKRSMAKQSEKWGGRKAKFQAGEYGSSRNAFTRGVRRAGQMSGQSVFTGFGTTGRGKQNLALDADSKANELLKDGKFVAATYDDDARRALQLGSVKAAQQAGISEEAINKARAVGFNSSTQLAAIKAESSNKGRNFTGLDGIDALNAQIDAVAKSTGVNAEDLRSEVAYGMRTQGGRFDLGALDATKTASQQAISGWNKGSLYQHSNSQGNSFETIHEAFRNNGDAEQLAIFHEEAKSMAPNATGDVAGRIEGVVGSTSATHQFVESYYAAGPTSTQQARMQETTVNPVTGAEETRVVEDPTNTVTVRQNEQAVKKKSRTYKAPNPNEIDI